MYGKIQWQQPNSGALTSLPSSPELSLDSLFTPFCDPSPLTADSLTAEGFALLVREAREARETFEAREWCDFLSTERIPEDAPERCDFFPPER